MLIGAAVRELVGAMHSFLYVDIHFLLAVLGENKRTTKLSCLVPETERESFPPNGDYDLELCKFTSFCLFCSQGLCEFAGSVLLLPLLLFLSSSVMKSYTGACDQ